MKKLLLILILLLIPNISFAALGDQNNPAVSCLHIKQSYPSANDGKYWIKSKKMTNAKQYYCDMTTDGGGWMLIFKRRTGRPTIAWENYNNKEECGNNLNEFLHGDCGSINDLGYKKSYSSNIGETLAKNNFGEYLFLDYELYYKFGWKEKKDTDDSFIIHSGKNIFPNNLGLSNIGVEKICDVNNTNCDSSNVIWKYTGKGWFASSLCNENNFDNGISYSGNYGYCHNGYSGKESNSLFGNRKGYNETKLWNYNGGDSKNYSQKVFIRRSDPFPTDITLSNNNVNSNSILPANVGVLTTVDESEDDSHTYTLVGTNNDNGSFSINGNNLIINSITKNNYILQIRTTDSHENYFEKTIFININGTNEPGSSDNPIISCQDLKNKNPNFPSGIYWLKNSNMVSAKQVYCEMEKYGGGWMLLFQRRGGGINTESCGTNLNDFLQNECGNIFDLSYGKSYSADVDKTISEIGATKYLFLQKDAKLNTSTDSYIIYSNNNLFPNNVGSLKEIHYQKICDINDTNCDSSPNNTWLYAGTSRFNSAYCNGGYAGSTAYKGNYGYCHNGVNNKTIANSLFGTRKGYDETKLWGHTNGAMNYKEMVFIKNDNDNIKPIIKNFSPNENDIRVGKKLQIEINYSDENSGINTNSKKIYLYKWSNNSWGENIISSKIVSGNVTNSQAIYDLENMEYGKYKYNFSISDNAGNTSSIEKVFYIDAPKMILNKDVLDLGNLKENQKVFSDILNIKIKTIGAGFKLYLKNEENPTNGIYILENWNNSKGYGYNIDGSQNIKKFTNLGVLIAEKTKNINNSGELNLYNYNLKLGELLKDLLPAGEYKGKIGFHIIFSY